MNYLGIGPTFGCNWLETEICQSNTNEFSPVSTKPLFTLIAKNTGYVIERKNGFVAEKQINCVQRGAEFVSVTAGET